MTKDTDDTKMILKILGFRFCVVNILLKTIKSKNNLTMIKKSTYNAVLEELNKISVQWLAEVTI